MNEERKPSSDGKKSKTKSEPVKMGRPSDYSPEKADAICFRLANGESLRSICRSEEMPDMSTVLRWLGRKDLDHFRLQYAHAKEVGLEMMADEILEIADETAFDTIATKDGFKADNEWIQRSKLRVDTRKWVLSKLLPKKYGEKITTELTGADGGAVQISDTERAAKVKALLNAAATRKGGNESK